MKNKKLFAILTLVCFMFTLMPVAAFAANPYDLAELAFTADGTALASGVKLNELSADNKTTSGYKTLAEVDVDKNYVVVSNCGVDVEIPAADITTGKAIKDAAAVVAAKYAAKNNNNAVNDMSALVLADDADSVVTKATAEAGIDFKVLAKNNKGYVSNFAAKTLYVWAVDAEGVTTALTVESDGWYKSSSFTNVYKNENAVADGATVKISFARAGEYTVYAALGGDSETKLANLNKLTAQSAVKITVRGTSVDPDTYMAALNNNAAVVAGEELGTLPIVTPNNVLGAKQVVTFTDAAGDALTGKTVAIETNSSSIEVNKASDVTDAFGNIDFRVSASVEGDYEIDLTVDGVTWTIVVTVGNTEAAYIATVTEPTAPLALYGGIEDEVEFEVTDINGNVVTNAADLGMEGIKYNAVGFDGAPAGSYVVLTEKPEASNIESADLKIVPETDANGNKTGVWVLSGLTNFDAEGTYAVKVVLDNGAYATATWEVKKFQTPVSLVIGSSTNVIELGGTIQGELLYFDVNGVQKAAKDVEFAATGYAVENAVKYNASNAFDLTAKDDEKYVDSTITVTAVSEKYDLVATKEYKVADAAVAVAFVDKAADVNVNNKLEWNIVDSTGTRVALGANADVQNIQYIVLDKPEGAKVSTNDATNASDLANKGIGKLALTSNKVGNVAVQVVVKAYFDATAEDAAQTKYYTGTQIIAVGTQGVGDVVVMSIGSNEIVINDAKATIDAAPIVENNRTFVPFRALAEAFGATVAYDEATQAVTAELNGVTVVMTIGSAEYTVNGVAKTADVAPFINGSRTMVPVRFAAEAFGIKVIPTYDENGATADILFNL